MKWNIFCSVFALSIQEEEEKKVWMQAWFFSRPRNTLHESNSGNPQKAKNENVVYNRCVTLINLNSSQSLKLRRDVF